MTTRTFPASPTDLTPTWLSSTLGTPVDAVRFENLGEGVGVLGEVTRLHIYYPDGPSDERPATLILKTPATADENRVLATQYGFYSREVNFYKEAARESSLRVPDCYFAAMDDSSCPFALILEDVVGARVVDQLVGPSVTEAEMVIDGIAALHARWWDSPDLDALDWLPPINNDLYQGFAEVLPQLIPVLEQRYGDRLEPEGFGPLNQLAPLYTNFLDYWMKTGPTTFIHYDLRTDNILFDPPSNPGSICMLDWQLAVRHRGTFDMSYFLGQSVPTEFRRANEDTLLRRYHDALTGLGVTGYSFEQCWDDYRRGMLMHFAAATQTAVLEGGNDRGQRLLDSIVTRGWTAALDLDAAAFLPELASL